MGLSQNRTCGSSHPAPPRLSPLGMLIIITSEGHQVKLIRVLVNGLTCCALTCFSVNLLLLFRNSHTKTVHVSAFHTIRMDFFVLAMLSAGNRWFPSSYPRRSTRMFDPSSTAVVPHWLLSDAGILEQILLFFHGSGLRIKSPPFESRLALATHRASSPAIAAFPAGLFTTIPSSDCSPSVAVPRPSRPCSQVTAMRER